MGAAYSPGRVNLIGDHTDYTGGLALPMAIDLGTTVDIVAQAHGGLALSTDAAVEPDWTRYVAATMEELGLQPHATGDVTTTLPLGAGLSSSAALAVATALALGFDGTALELAKLCQRAEQRGTGVPCGLMDQLTCAAGVEGAALLVDFGAEVYRPVTLPDGVAVHIVHSGVSRSLAASEYAERRGACEAAALLIGPLRDAAAAATASLPDPLLAARARHVISENRRVLEFAAMLEIGDLDAAGHLMLESHASLRDDFEVSHPALDRVVDRLGRTTGVYGARLTGAGFGGCVVALTDSDVDDAAISGSNAGHWRVRPSAGARRL